MASSTIDIASVLAPVKDPLRVQLNDARLVTIRSILPSDLDALRTFFSTLSRATLRFRFHSSINELSEHLLHEFTMVNHRGHVAFVAETREKRDQSTTIVAEARYVRKIDSDSAEFALVVADDWRRIGLGTTLTRILAQCARFAGVLRLRGDILEDNKAMRGLAHSLGAKLSREVGSRTVRLSMEV
jgi:acetyltransferase